jgi:hypothetical protein
MCGDQNDCGVEIGSSDCREYGQRGGGGVDGDDSERERTESTWAR